jgi:prepilin-type N-terminal cleavage/methylation domain-containing protein
MCKLEKTKKNGGFTLIELIVTLAIFSIVLVAILNLFLFNNRVYSRSENLSEVQFDVRMASDYITTELRNKNSISITDNSLAESITLSDLQSKYPTVKAVTFKIAKSSSDYFVEYTITGSDLNNDNEYTLETDVLLNNITNATESTGTTIYYE